MAASSTFKTKSDWISARWDENSAIAKVSYAKTLLGDCKRKMRKETVEKVFHD